jgi:hypothetical protein
MPPLNLDAFRNLANTAWVTSRDLVVTGQGDRASVKRGNYIFSQGAKANDATMAAFKEALEKEYGVFGTHAFDTVVGARNQLHLSLRACDVEATLSKLDSVKVTRFIGELSRQLDTNPKFRTLSPEVRQKIRSAIADEPLKNADPKQCKSQAEIARLAVNRLDAAIRECRTGDVAEEIGLDGRKQLESAAAGREPTGLRNLKDVFREKDTSIEDRIKKGQIGSGMRVNRSNTNPVLLDKLKTNGVEPGFIFRNDWSKDDTHGFMADIHSEASRRALEDLKAKNPGLRTACEGMTLREQIMLAGRAHPAGMAAVSEFVLERAVELALRPNKNHPFQELAQALKNQFSEQDLQRLLGAVSEPRNKGLLKEAKLYLFTEIRDAVMSVGPGGNTADFYEMSPVFKHFSDRAIVKLDYNEGDKLGGGEAASAGKFRRPERILATRGAIVGPIYRFTSRQSADKISAGAVTEALANDLTRIAGVPAQELEIVRGKYSDGHPKIMLAAKFAVGYRDMEDGMLKDGRAVPPPRGKSKNAPPPPQPEPLGKYKAFFLLTADRDGVGKRGQNKGFVNGKFFAIDPGHSLEGNGKYLKISDDLSFKDTYGKSLKPRFDNFSVFDDDTFFSKMEGVVNLRKLADAGEFKKLFDDYRAAFDPDEPGIDGAEKSLRQMIRADINKKETEFNENIKKILDVSANNLELFDDLADDGPAIQQGAIETVANLEKLTSPTTWVSKKGEVALEHLEVMQDSRVPWKGALKGDNIVYFCETKMSYETTQLLESVVETAGGRCETDALGVTRVTVPKDKAAQFFAAFTEEKVQQITHPAEYQARKEGGDGLKEAAPWKPVPYHTPSADPRPLMSVDSLPEQIDFAVDGRVYKFPKIHYQDLVTTRSSVHRPRNEGELRALLEAQVRRGFDVLGALQSGREHLFKPTNENIVALTYALHALALKKGEYMYRGSFSIEDRNGSIARWLDKADNLYIRTSTHAKPYQTAHVDGHLNMPRGYDVPTGAGGLLNGMRTFHFFTIPDADGLKDGGNGPRRRLFLKCETFGIFCSTAHLKIFDKPASVAEGMQTRGYRFGDILESICHGTSLFASFFTPKEAPGIRKENLTEVQKKAILWAQEKLRPRYPALAERLTAGGVLDGAGINAMVGNFNWILEHMPEDEDERAWITDVLDYMFTPMEQAVSPLQSGDFANRIGNEIMIDAKDLM